MDEKTPQGAGGLSPQYQTYKHQKCFIAFSEQAEWSDDLLSACQEVLCRPEFSLEPDDASKHFDPDVPLRQKVLELIANARYGIYDLSYWRDEKGEWQMPRNVFIELGMAIALNRPTLLLRHANNRELELPECLKSVSGHILEFSGETTLKRALEERLPQWVSAPPEREWWNRYCIFGGRRCEYREAHPRARQWGQKTLRCHISDGPEVDRDDFRGVVEEVLRRFGGVSFDYLDTLLIPKGYDFLLCTHCQTVRSTPYAIYRITHQTPAETFIAIGMSIALETQFEYKIPKILLTENVKDVPSLLSGYEVIVARSDSERRSHLRRFMPAVLQKVRETTWKPRPLPFTETIPSIVDGLSSSLYQPPQFISEKQIQTTDDSESLTRDIIKVSARSRTTAVAGAIAGVVKENNRAEMQAIGAGAVNQAIKACAIAHGYLAEDGIDVEVIPEFVGVMIGEQERTAVRLVVDRVDEKQTQTLYGSELQSYDIIKVSAQSRSTAVAGAIAGLVRESNRADVQAVVAGAVNQAVKACAIARGYLAEDGIHVSIIPSFVDVVIGDQERTAVRLVVVGRLYG